MKRSREEQESQDNLKSLLEKYTCPITHLIFCDPVTVVHSINGQNFSNTFERAAILHHFARSEKPRNLLTRNPLPADLATIEIDQALKAEVGSFLELYPQYRGDLCKPIEYIRSLKNNDVAEGCMYCCQLFPMYVAEYLKTFESELKDHFLRYRDQSGNSFLQVIIQQLPGIVSAVLEVIPRNPFLLTHKNHGGDTILHTAARYSKA